MTENRVVRRGPDGRRYQFSNAVEMPNGRGWGRTDPTLFPHVHIYNWFRPAEMIGQDNSDEVKQWISACKEFALHEHIHITTTNTPLPHQEYLDFFNERLTPDGKYIEWKDE